MYCVNCGASVSSTNNFCPSCGFNTAAQQVPAKSAVIKSEALRSMKWFLFWTYVVLPVIVLRSFVGAFLLAASDWPFAALSLCIATLYVAIIYCLHKRQLLGWWLNWASIAAVIPIILI